MCGLVGATGLYTKEERAVTYLLFMNNVLRGFDGCGFVVGYQEDKQATYKLHKTTQPSSTFVNENPFQKYVMQSTGKLDFIAAHSRAATVGKVNRKNSHPFDFENVIGMHNGTCFGKYPLKDKYETDSEALFAHINTVGVKAAIEEFEKESSSFAYALVWIDKDTDTINFLRNNDRPLFIAKNKVISGQVFWSSSSLTLDYSLKSVGLGSGYEILPLPVNELHSYDLKQSFKEADVVKDFIKKPVKTYYYPEDNNAPWRRNHHHHHVPDTKPSKGEVKELFNESKYIRLDARVLPEKIFLKLLEKGCCMCGQPTTLINQDFNMRFISSMPNEFLCKECLDSTPANTLEQDYMIKQEYLITPEEYNLDGDV